MVGRDAELSALTDALTDADGGLATVALVAGEAGAGKTRLVTEFVKRARASGAVTLVGGCFPLGGVSPPYAPLAQAIRSHLRTLPAEAAQTLTDLLPPQLLPGFGATGAGALTGAAEQRAVLFDRMGVAFGAMSATAPVLLVLEDVHWADPSTRDSVAYLAHMLTDERVLLVVSHRIDEVDRQPDLRTWLVHMRRAARTAVVELTQLSRDDIAEQIAGLTGTAPTDDLVDTVAARADGNPLHVEELISAGPPPPTGQLPSTLLDAITSRLERLPSKSRRLIRAAAAIGRRMGDDLLCVAAGRRSEHVIDAMRPAIAQHLIRPVPGELAYEFHHELVREAAYAELLPGERQAVHARISRYLAAERNEDLDPTHLALVAYHWTQADDHLHAIPALIAAGAAAMDSTGFAEAHDQLSCAIRWWLRSGGTPAEEIAPGWDLTKAAQLAGRASLLCGETAEGRALGELVLDRLDPDGDPLRYAELTATQGVLRMLDGDTSAARAAYEHALALLPADQPTSTRATVLYRFASVCGFLGEDELVYRYAAEAAHMAQLLGEPALEGRASALLAFYATPHVEEQAAMDMARRALALSTASGDVEAIMGAYVAFTDVSQTWGSVPDRLASAQQGLAVATRLGATSSQAASDLTNRCANALFCSGDWRSAEQLWEGLLARPRDRHTAVIVPVYMVDLLIAQGQFERAAELLPADSALQPWGDWMLAVVDGARAELAIWQARLDEADSALRRAAGITIAYPNLDPVMNSWYIGWLIATAERVVADVVQLAAANGAAGVDADKADPDALLSAWIGQQERHPRASTLRMRAWLCMADAEHTRRDRSDPAAWSDAVAAWDDYGDTWRAAYARFRVAEALVATSGDRSGATEPLRLAWDFCRRVGALPLLAEIEALAKRARIPLESAAAVAATSLTAVAVLHGLTDRETDVVRLLADGATNAQIGKTLFISEKTAATHVSNILRKLGAARRTEAAAIAHRLGITNQPDRANEHTST